MLSLKIVSNGGILRDKNTDKKLFRELVNELSVLLFFEASRDLETEKVKVKTPIMETTCTRLTGQAIEIVPILRAGLGMCDQLLEFVPTAKVGHLGMARNEKTLQPEEYYKKMPTDINSRHIFIVDPMLATGGSMISCIENLKQDGAKKITVVSIISAPEGVAKTREKYPEIDIYTAQLDEKLNDNGYIIPGLGDAGDRLFGTL